MSPAVLREWANLPLEKRCRLIEEKYKKKMIRNTLARYYKLHRIRYLRIQKTLKTKSTNKSLDHARVAWVNQLMTFIQKDYEVFYIDETSTNIWDCSGRIWQPMDNNLPVRLRSGTHHNHTIIGALSSLEHAMFHFDVVESTNSDTVKDFFFNLFERLQTFKNKIFVMDQHNAHKIYDVGNLVHR